MSTLKFRTGEMFALAAAVAFSFKAIIVKFAIAASLDPLAFLAMRMMLAGPIFFALLWWNPDQRWPKGADRWKIVALGLVGFYLASMLDFLGLKWLSAGLERIVLYTHPTFVLLLGAWWSGRWPAPRAWAAVTVAWLGLVVAAGADAMSMDPLDLARGVALVLGCALLYAVYLLGVEDLGRTYGTFRVAAMANVCAALALTVHGAVRYAPDLQAATPELWGLALLTAVGSTVLPAILLTAAIHRIGPGRASTFGMIGPFVASLLGWALLHEPLSMLQLAGGAMVVGGVTMAAPRGAPAQAK